MVNTRNAASFTLPPHHLSLYEKKPSYKGALLYNHLPEELKKEPAQHLKIQLTTWLQDRPFYTEKEFLTTSSSFNKLTARAPQAQDT
ncbi:hypothetical protein J6590_051763 [Homalodisca vitripennis]|nr:hypothetical protein J6590_051763 [Homalodisca vitripennis]